VVALVRVRLLLYSEYSSSVHRVVVYIAAAVGVSDVMCRESQAFLWRVTATSNCHAPQVLEHSV
jgi:hypothetical protein